MRRLILFALPIVMILSSCGNSATLKAIKNTPSSSPTSLSQPSATVVTPPPLSTIVGHTPDATAIQTCGYTSPSYFGGTYTQFQNFLVSVIGPPVFGYNIYKKLSDNLPVKPYRLTYDPAKPGDAFRGSYESGPPLQIAPDSSVPLGFEICNFTKTPQKITSIFVHLDAFTPYTQVMNVWESSCSSDTYFTRPDHIDTSGGCGGAVATIGRGTASFGINDPKSAIGTYAQTIPAQSDNTTFPVIIAPVGQSADPDIQVVQVKGFTAPGLYTLSLGIVDESGKLIMLPSSFSYYSIPQARRWSGQPCLSNDMQAQIPTEVTNPPTYYICPGNLVTHQ
jgi:hypothetical protein